MCQAAVSNAMRTCTDTESGFDVSLDCTVITALMYRHLKRSQTHQKREPHARTHTCCVFCFRLTQHGSSLSLPESPLPDSLFTSSWLTIRLVHACVCVCLSSLCVQFSGSFRSRKCTLCRHLTGSLHVVIDDVQTGVAPGS